MRSRLQAAAVRGFSRFVGRSAEIEQLRRALDQARGGHGQVVGVVGEPGVGKSRLFHQFTHTHRAEDCLILQASSVSYGKATTYLPVIDLLKRYFNVTDHDSHRGIREKVTGKVLTLDRALEPFAPAFLALLDVPVDDPRWQNLEPAQRRQLTLDGIKRLVLRESHIQPVVVIFEDLHWIDPETQAVLDGLVDGVPTAKVLLLVNYRPEYTHPWGSKTYYARLRLDPLSRETSTELLAALLGDDAGLDPLKRMLSERTAGNPLFLEESVRVLVDTGALAGNRGAYRLARPIDAIQVPPTVQSILAARIDRLASEEKNLLQAAAVIGKDIAFALLQAIADQDDHSLRRGLARLQAAEFLYETSLFPEVEYTFKHALTHDVAYGMLLETQRTALHLKVVGAIERLFASRLDEHVERLALHASRAHAWEQAIAYGRQAGIRALGRCSFAQALKYFEDARELIGRLPDDRRRAEIAIDTGAELNSALSPLGELDRCLALNEADLGLARGLGDPRRIALTASRRTNLFSILGDPARGLPFAHEALHAADTVDDAWLQARIHWVLGQALQLTGDFPRAIEALRKAVAVLPEDMLGRRDRGMASAPGLTSMSWIAVGLAELGHFDEALELGERAMESADALGHAFSLGMASWGYAYTELLRGELPKAQRISDRVTMVCGDARIPLLVTPWSASLGYARVLAGNISEGLAALQHSRDAIANNRYMEAQFLAWLGHGQALAGRSSEALTSAHTALELSQCGQQRGQEAWALRILGEIVTLATSRDLSVGSEYFRRAADLGSALGMRPLVAHCHAGLAKLCRRTGKQRQADEYFSTATAMYREMGMRFWLDKAEAELKA